MFSGDEFYDDDVTSGLMDDDGGGCYCGPSPEEWDEDCPWYGQHEREAK